MVYVHRNIEVIHIPTILSSPILLFDLKALEAFLDLETHLVEDTFDVIIFSLHTSKIEKTTLEINLADPDKREKILQNLQKVMEQGKQVIEGAGRPIGLTYFFGYINMETYTLYQNQSLTVMKSTDGVVKI